MKVTVENKKNLEKNLKVLIDKTIINKELEQRYEQIKKDVVRSRGLGDVYKRQC